MCCTHYTEKKLLPKRGRKEPTHLAKAPEERHRGSSEVRSLHAGSSRSAASSKRSVSPQAERVEKTPRSTTLRSSSRSPSPKSSSARLRSPSGSRSPSPPSRRSRSSKSSRGILRLAQVPCGQVFALSLSLNSFVCWCSSVSSRAAHAGSSSRRRGASAASRRQGV